MRDGGWCDAFPGALADRPADGNSGRRDGGHLRLHPLVERVYLLARARLLGRYAHDRRWGDYETRPGRFAAVGAADGGGVARLDSGRAALFVLRRAVRLRPHRRGGQGITRDWGNDWAHRRSQLSM